MLTLITPLVYGSYSADINATTTHMAASLRLVVAEMSQPDEQNVPQKQQHAAPDDDRPESDDGGNQKGHSGDGGAHYRRDDQKTE